MSAVNMMPIEMVNEQLNAKTREYSKADGQLNDEFQALKCGWCENCARCKAYGILAEEVHTLERQCRKLQSTLDNLPKVPYVPPGQDYEARPALAPALVLAPAPAKALDAMDDVKEPEVKKEEQKAQPVYRVALFDVNTEEGEGSFNMQSVKPGGPIEFGGVCYTFTIEADGAAYLLDKNAELKYKLGSSQYFNILNIKDENDDDNVMYVYYELETGEPMPLIELQTGEPLPSNIEAMSSFSASEKSSLEIVTFHQPTGGSRLFCDGDEFDVNGDNYHVQPWRGCVCLKDDGEDDEQRRAVLRAGFNRVKLAEGELADEYYILFFKHKAEPDHVDPEPMSDKEPEEEDCDMEPSKKRKRDDQSSAANKRRRT